MLNTSSIKDKVEVHTSTKKTKSSSISKSRKRTNKRQGMNEPKTSIKKVIPSPGSACKRKRSMDSQVETRRKQFHQQTGWRPIDEQMFPTPVKDGSDSENSSHHGALSASVVMSPGVPRSKRPGVLQEINTDAANSHYRFRNIFIQDTQCRASPLPALSWTDSNELWRAMVEKETIYQRSGSYISNHPDLQPRMRSILLDWLMEVSEVYSLHRETFYLSVDYIDRYLSNTSNIHKTRLQLVGVTALFVAAKLEEIYPPKLSDFAYVTDGACSEDDILAQELLILNKLEWSLAPVTTVAWLNVFLQTAHAEYARGHVEELDFFIPQYPQQTFVHITQLLDLCSLDLESLDFPPGVLAASALYHFSCREVATQVSGYHFKDIIACVQWMAPFAITVRDTGLQPLKQFRRVQEADYHNIQTHANNVDILDMAHENRVRSQTQFMCQSPTEIGGFMTPPKSGQKSSVITTPQAGDVC